MYGAHAAQVVYRRYASLFFLVGVDGDENELAVLEFVHALVESLDKYFGNVCELDIMFQLEKAHMILDGACCATARTFGWVGGWVYGGGRRTRAYVCLHSDAARAVEVWLRSPASLFACMLVAHARRAQSLTPTAALLDATPPPPHPPALHADARTRGPWACTRARLSCSHYRDGYGWLSR